MPDPSAPDPVEAGGGRDRLPSWSRSDLRALAQWSLGSLLAAALPPGSGVATVDRLLALDRRRIESKVPRLAARLAAVLQPFGDDVDFEAAARGHYEMKLEEKVGLWWSLRGRSWRLELEVEGREHLDAALAAGRGVVLWGMSFCATLAPKAALHQLGLPLVHLSGARHGAPVPVTRLGLSRIAPLQVRAESLYLVERVVIDPDATVAGLRRLRPHLDANRCVWITGDGGIGRTMVPVTLLGRERGLPTGATTLALHSGAALLPVEVERLARCSYRVIFGAPVAPPAGRARRTWVAESVSRYAALLERAVLRHPGDWDWNASWLDAAPARAPATVAV